MNNKITKTEIFSSEKAPFYIYEKSIIEGQINILKDMLPQFDFLYSIKSNPYAPVVNYIASRGIGSDAASLREVEISAEAGIFESDIYYSAPGKSFEDIEKSLDKCIIIADSYHELEIINSCAVARGIKVKAGIRINPCFTMTTSAGVSTKFGVDEETLVEHRDFFIDLSNVEIVGIHVHVKSQELDSNRLYNYYKNVFELALFCKEKVGFNIEFINFGGGLGVAYSKEETALDYDLLKEKCLELTEAYSKKLNARLLIESGRFLVCQCGTYVTEIVDIKESRGTKYLIVKNTLNGFFKPSVSEMICSYLPSGNIGSSEPLFTSKDAFEVTIDTNEKNTEIVNIVGHLCTAVDIMAHNIVLPKAKIGDKILVSNAGSYAYSLSPMLFASQPLPEQIFID